MVTSTVSCHTIHSVNMLSLIPGNCHGSLLLCSFIKYCSDEGGYTGVALTDENEDLLLSLSALCIGIKTQGDTSLFSFLSPSRGTFWSVLKLSIFLSVTLLISGDCWERGSAVHGPWVEARRVNKRTKPRETKPEIENISTSHSITMTQG